MDRVRARVKDKRVLALVKAFLKAGVLTELGEHRDTLTAQEQGGLRALHLAGVVQVRATPRATRRTGTLEP